MKRETKILRMIYRELNTKAFNNTLPMCKVKYINNEKKRWCGAFKFWEMTIIINKAALNNKESMLKETMLHEMVHVKQWIKHWNTDNDYINIFKHNKYFFRILRKACKDANIKFDDNYYQAVKALDFNV
jgi:predicted SprT family Zn-dependent metalloprotease